MSEKRNSKKDKPQEKAEESGSSSPMDVALLARLVELMTRHDLNTVDVRDGERRVILRRGSSGAAVHASHAPAPVSHTPAPAPTAPLARTASAAETGEEAAYTRITSPMVGTFYAAPKPGEKPFVTVGMEVTEDTDVCIIEAMKTFNNIKAECRGLIAKVLAQDGQPVEFGTVLFLVKPS